MKKNFHYIEFSRPNASVLKLLKALDENKNNVSAILSNKSFKNYVEACKKKLKHGKLGVVLRFNYKNKSFSPNTIIDVTKAVSLILGKKIVQNEKGDKLVYVFDRDRNLSINSGGRYHQTREGGSIHTDNVNLKLKWDYLILSCVSKAEIGGETILVNGKEIYKILKRKFKLALSILQKNFYWEKRGISESFYKSPIIEFNKKKEPTFRYLRPYMISAHEKVKKPLSPLQLYSLDVLDSLLEAPENQVRFNLSPGDILLTIDNQVLHGRTSFSDFYNSEEIFKNKKTLAPLKRTMIRAWIKDSAIQRI